MCFKECRDGNFLVLKFLFLPVKTMYFDLTL